MVEHAVTPVAASNANCGWAAAMATLLARGSDTEVVEHVQAHFPDRVTEDGLHSLGPAELAGAFGLSAEASPYDTAAEWADLLAHGPVVAMLDLGGGSLHCVVVSGVVVSDDEATVESTITVVDPMNGGSTTLAFSTFLLTYDVRSIVVVR